MIKVGFCDPVSSGFLLLLFIFSTLLFPASPPPPDFLPLPCPGAPTTSSPWKVCQASGVRRFHGACPKNSVFHQRELSSKEETKPFSSQRCRILYCFPISITRKIQTSQEDIFVFSLFDVVSFLGGPYMAYLSALFFLTRGVQYC